MNIFGKIWRQYGINPLDSLLRKAQVRGARRFLICWNRGLGDIPLGLSALIHRIRAFIPDARITFVTRKDLAEGFALLPGVTTVVAPDWKRGVAFDLDRTFRDTGLCKSDFDLILEKPDPTNWLRWQLGNLVPRLTWKPEWDALYERFGIPKGRSQVGVHVQTETQYTYEKNWPLEYWKEFFHRMQKEQDVGIVLFGFVPTPTFEGEWITDLRGRTTLFEMLSVIKNCCWSLLVPDSGILSMTYYLDAAFPVHIVSLWADPGQGVLRQNVASPNSLLRHTPLIAKNKDLRTVDVDSAIKSLFAGGR